MKRVIICGSRSFADLHFLIDTMDRLTEKWSEFEVVSGAAKSGADPPGQNNALHGLSRNVPKQIFVFSQKIATDPINSPVAVMTGAHEGLETLLQFFVLRCIDGAALRALEHLQCEVADILGGVFDRPDAMLLIKSREPEIRRGGTQDLRKRQVPFFTLGPQQLGNGDIVEYELQQRR